MLDLAESTKRCTRCKEEKPTGSFTGRRWWCRACVSAYNVQWRAKNHESIKGHSLRWYRKNIERARQLKRDWRAKNKDKMGAQMRRQKYGLNNDRYLSMLADCGGLCAICREPTDRLHVDHNHSTGQVRELLCRGCNNGIGNFRENTALMEAAIAYIKKHGGG